MTWLRMEDNMLDHPKWRRAVRLGGDEVVAIWFRLVSWCSRNLTDGRVPADVVAQVAEVRSVERSRAIRALADAGLISFSHPTDSGLTAVSHESDVMVTDYLQRNPSREDVLSERRRRGQSQRLRRHAENEAGLHETSEAVRSEVPIPSQSHPNPIPSHVRDRARDEPPSVPGLTRLSGPACVSRTYTMPGEAPAPAYLDEAAMGGVSREQAAETWKYYFGAGLPERGVERLHKWLVQRAKERANALSKAPPASGRRGSGDVMAYALSRISEEEAKERAGS